VGTDTCQLLIYNADKGKITHTFDPVSYISQPWRQLDAPERPVLTCFTVLLLPWWRGPAGPH
jgi:hypothetical protein